MEEVHRMMRHQAAPRARATVAGFAAAVLVVGTAGAALAQSPSPATGAAAHPELAGQTLVVSNWAAYMPDDLPALFEAEYGVPVTVTNHATNEDVVGKITAGGSGLDVAFLSGQFAQALGAAGFLAQMDHDQIPNLANLYPEASQLAYDPGNLVSVPYSWGTTGLCYRADLTGYDPDSWYDLLQPKENVSGTTTALATQRWLMLPAQKALGFSANTVDPAEMEQVKELLLAAKPTLLAYDDTTFYQRLISGEASLVEAWDGWCNYAIGDAHQGTNVKWVVPKEGSDLWVDTMTILADSPNKEAAHAFIDFVLRPEVQAWVVDNISYKVPNAAAMELVSPETLAAFPNLSITPAELLAGESLVDLGDDGAELYQRISDEVIATQ
jgi:spermidine/putrescine transport system substrate-binding protein